MIPAIDHYWLRNAHIPSALMVRSKQVRSKDWVSAAGAEWLQVDLEISAGAIASLSTAGTLSRYNAPSVDLRGGIVFPCFADLHTHLDKGHTWERCPNPNGTFAGALATVEQDTSRWTATDLYRRMEFGLKCSYAHGTKALRTHLDSGGDLASLSFEVMKTLQQEWRDRMLLQAVCLVSLDTYLTPAGEKLANLVVEQGGVLGGVAYLNPDIDRQIERVVAIAKDRKLDLDLHTDETNDPNSNVLQRVAAAALRQGFKGQIVCGHCCSLAVQAAAEVEKTIDLVKRAKIGIVSLPLCNLYLQDSVPNRTPRWRGVTLLHELKQAEVPVAIASDNCRDPFYGYGDHDALEILSWSTKIAHLDRPFGDWCRAITTTPADLMGLPAVGRIGVGLPADLVIFKARHYSELFSRSQRDRIILRTGQAIDTTLPDYADLDDLLQTP
jgi:cytosine deaminase